MADQSDPQRPITGRLIHVQGSALDQSVDAVINPVIIRSDDALISTEAAAQSFLDTLRGQLPAAATERARLLQTEPAYVDTTTRADGPVLVHALVELIPATGRAPDAEGVYSNADDALRRALETAADLPGVGTVAVAAPRHGLSADLLEQAARDVVETARAFLETGKLQEIRIAAGDAELAGIYRTLLPDAAAAPVSRLPDAARLHALLVGLDNSGPELSPLRGCANDVAAMHALLVETLGVPAGNVHRLLDEEATAGNVLRTWQSILRHDSPLAQLLFHFSGHGRRFDPGRDSVLIFFGGEQISHGELLETLVRPAIEDAQQGEPPAVTLLLDTHFTGSPAYMEYVAGEWGRNYLTVLAAAHANQDTVEMADDTSADARDRGVFSQAVTAALAGYHPEMTWGDLFDRVQVALYDRVPDQDPQLIGLPERRIFGDLGEQRPHHLLVTDLREDGLVEVNAHPALGLEPGDQVRIFAPGGGTDGPPLTPATVAEVGERSVLVAPARTGLVQTGCPVLPAQGVPAESRTGQQAQHARLLARRNDATDAALHDAVTLELRASTSGDGDGGLSEGETVTLLLRNNSRDELYAALWQLRADFSARQIWPTATDCRLLPPLTALELPMTLDLSRPEETSEEVHLKLFAGRRPLDLRVLELPPQPVTGEDGLLPGAGLRAKLWQPGRTLRIRFLDGDPALHSLVEEVARQWVQEANLFFDFGDDPEAEVRISFTQPGSWSYQGTDCLAVAPDQPTMNFGWLTPATEPSAAQQIILREFGHMLGLISEHQNPNAHIAWDRAAVLRTYMGPPNNWSREQVERIVLRTHDPAELAIPKPFDPDSIMMWPIPADHTLDGRSYTQPDTLSQWDRRSVALLYPLGQETPAPDDLGEIDLDEAARRPE